MTSGIDRGGLRLSTQKNKLKIKMNAWNDDVTIFYVIRFRARTEKSFQYLIHEGNIECYAIAPTLGAQRSKALTSKHKEHTQERKKRKG